MDSIYAWRLFLKRFLLLLGFYTSFRLFFFVMNLEAYRAEPPLELAVAFARGLQFDSWAILWSNLAIAALTFLPNTVQGSRAVQNFILGMALTIHLIAVTLNFIDVELFKLTGRRLAMDWLRLQKDVQHQSTGLVQYYWWLFFCIVAVSAILWWLWPRWKSAEAKSRSLFANAIVLAAVLPLLALGLRGGTDLKPLNITDAYLQGSSVMGVLTLNSTFSFFKNQTRIESLSTRFFADPLQAKKLVQELAAPDSPHNGELKGWNVVIIIVESLAAEYVGALNDGKGYTPFLDELANKGWLFRHTFANGRRSIEALPSIICGLPSLMSEAFILSPFQGVDLHCLGERAQQAGYSSHFFHGAYNGSMHFDSFARRAGFQKFYGYNEYPNAKDSDGHWGIYDEPLLQFSLQTLDAAKKPFAATIFTLTSHYPYQLPEAHRDRYPKGELEIHESIGYVDEALRQFFKSAESKDWFNNTLFFITGDHTQKSSVARFQNTVGVYNVPLLVYAPGKSWPANTDRITQHADIFPTTIDLLGWPQTPRLAFGQSVFSARPGVFFSGDNWGFWLLKDRWLSQYSLAQKKFLFAEYDGSTGVKNTPLAEDLWPGPVPMDAQLARESLKSVVDYFNEGIINNSLYRFQ
jgi:phosphoglycerol transferase MdoB-like AlkP superfamily enzyme